MALEILELILWLVLEVFGNALLEIVLEPIFAGLKTALGRENRHPAIAAIGYAVLGAGIGGISVFLFPRRIVHAGRVPGLSLILGPLGAGAAMELWGRYRREGGHATTNLATWYGGATLAFGLSLVRFLCIR